MDTKWNLDRLYKGFDDPAWQADIEALEKAYACFKDAVYEAEEKADKPAVEAVLSAMEEIQKLSGKLGLFAGLRQAVNSRDSEAMAQTARLMKLRSAGAADRAKAKKALGGIEDLDALSADGGIIADYGFLLREMKREKSRLLSDEAESIIAGMNITGGAAWGQLQSFLTSTLPVEYEGKTIALSEVRNLAYDPDPAVREKAYRAELAAYDRIAESVAFALNNIKNQVTMLAEKRGFKSPLELTLEESNMKHETLDAMIGAMKDFMPAFRRYLRKKAELLGDPDGLRFYNLFAPLGSSDKKYTVEETRDTLVGVFSAFAPEMADMMAEAFDNAWIDFFPAEGKEGGAFCAEVPSLKESRILTNFDGSFSAVDTLAHELGHAFHNRMQENERPLNMDSSMQVAETASTFNETFLGAWALKNAKTREERLALLENDLREKTQCVVDIYSRYLFETWVFEEAKDRFLLSKDLQELMLKAQDQSYGDGLDKDLRHPFMWVCKGHYYSSGLSFYNFPYAFGNLFAEGLFALYTKDPEGFLPKYEEMLRTTGVHTVEECGELMGADLTKRDFWETSLRAIEREIDEFCAL